MYNNKFSRDREFIKDCDKPNERQMIAENYLKEYNIQGILTEMINYLLHKKSKSPIVAMIKYLGGLLTEKEREEYKIVIPDPQIDYHPIIEFPDYEKKCNSLLKENLSKEIFSNLITKTSKYGINIDDIMRVNKVYPKNNIGILLADADCLTKFEDVYKPIISKAHNLNSNDLKDYTQNHFNINNIDDKDIQKVDISSIEGINKISFSFSRNLTDSPFVCFLNIENRTEKIAEALTREIDKNQHFKSMYKNVNPNKRDLMKTLRNINYDFDFLNSVTPNDNLIQKQRVVYTYDKYQEHNLLILINYCDNLQIIATININKIKENFKQNEKQNNKQNDKQKDKQNDKQKDKQSDKQSDNNQEKTDLNEPFIRCFNEINDCIRQIQYYFGFEFNHNYGYLTSNIALLGKGFSITTEINLEQLCGVDYDENKLNEKLEKFDKYTDTYYIDKNENNESVLIVTSSPKISQESISEFFIQYFEKMQSLQIEQKNNEGN
jgi:hypothetical protein